MNILKQFRRHASRLLFGSTQYPELCSLGLQDPQADIQVFLSASAATCDVTRNHVIAATHPLTIGVVTDKAFEPEITRRRQVFLRVHESSGEKSLLGKIRLRMIATEPLGQERLCLFRTRGARNYCLSRSLDWRRYLRLTCHQWLRNWKDNPSEIRMLARELRALFVLYICPRPVFMVSVGDRIDGSIFPMDLVGTIGKRCFSLALHNTSAVLPLVERSRRIAVSSVPSEQMPIAYELGKNHKRPNVDWTTLPFELTASTVFRLPVPNFALRVRELEVETAHRLGSHTFFLCRIVHDQSSAEGLQFFQAHVFYERWRRQALPVGPA